jgi:hypothetical protein
MPERWTRSGRPMVVVVGRLNSHAATLLGGRRRDEEDLQSETQGGSVNAAG